MVIAFALAAAALFGSADFLGGVASRRAKAASVLVISAPAGVLVIFGAAADAITETDPLGAHLGAQFGRLVIWLAAALVAVGAAL